jgi:hypothetical protein
MNIRTGVFRGSSDYDQMLDIIMARSISFFIILCCAAPRFLFSQTLVASYPLPNYNWYNYVWDLTQVGNDFRVASDYVSGSSDYARIYRVTKTGVILDSMVSPLRSNHGIDWDGTYFWLAEGYRGTGCRIYKATAAGVIVDSFQAPTTAGGITVGIGDIAVEGNKVWYSVFSPDFATYPNGYAFAFDMTTKQLVDTIPLRGRQVIGIAFKGDTLFYANDNQYTGETERIYAYSRITRDTIFSFPAPDPDGTCNPRGLYWDGQFLWLVAERIGGSAYVYRTLYKYAITGQGSPVIAASPAAINYGNVVIGDTLGNNVTVTNTGTANLAITAFEFSSSSFKLASTFRGDTLAPNQSKTYRVLFSPTAYDTVTAIMEIVSNDGGTPRKKISLAGKGVYQGPRMYVSETSYNYGTRRVHSKNGWNFSIKNTGTLPLLIYSIAPHASVFSLDSAEVHFPVVVDSQQTANFRIWFHPRAAGNYNDTAFINTNLLPIVPFKLITSGSASVQTLPLGAAIWQSHIPDNPFAYLNDYKPMSMKEIADVNGDGVNDVIIAARNYLTLCFNGNSSQSGDILWKFNTGYNNNNTGAVMFEDALQIRDDVNGDGVQDVVLGCGGGNEFVYTISGRTGKTIWAYGDSINYDLGDINGLRADKDFNNDGINDVLVSASGSGSGGRHAIICLDGLTGAEIFNKTQAVGFTFDVTSTQNGGAICVDLGNGGPYKIHGVNNSGNVVWMANTADVIWSMKQIPDINNDGMKDIAAFCGGLNVKMYGISGSSGAFLWETPYPNFATFSTVRVISDRNNNGYPDLIFSGKEGVFRIDSKTGAPVWTNTLDNSYVFGTDELNDLNNDGFRDIAAGTKNSNLYILSGDAGAVLWQMNMGAATDDAVERVIRLKDIDGNYSDEFVAGTRDGRIICFSGGLNAAVPVELTAFTAARDGNCISLNWETATEENNKCFEVQRRVTTDGAGWTTIATVAGNGTTTEKHTYSFTDRSAPSSGDIAYRLKQVDYDGTAEYSREIILAADNAPIAFALYQNFPNPFNPVTSIRYQVPGGKPANEQSLVTLKVYDITGREAATLVNEAQAPGEYEVKFDVSRLSSGVYFYTLRAGGFLATKKLVLMR